ncbi:transmembrane protein 238-like [Siniperca chuatsi]|uniref:transmembrane protein 238-like n=1 Tax=Siniperca chuatsi TaxID=119488 RepID=UPI001CE0BF82|nr:transmembrane protein 238-like [Siniperca chuatsi]
MSTSVQVEPVMEIKYGGVGRCKCSFWFAVAHDILGVFIMMVGVFGGLVIHDLFIYMGAIIIFLSLIWWVFWYSGNIDVPPEELEDDVGLIKLKNRGLSRVVRRVSDRFSNGIRNSFRKNSRPIREGPAGNNGLSNTGTDVSLSTIYDRTIASSSKEPVRETLSI